MAINTYATLKTAIASWLENTELTVRIPDFIAFAEARINLELRCRDNEKRITAAFSTEFFDIPSNFLAMRTIHLTTDPIYKLEYESPEQIDINHPYSTTGQPLVYSIHGTEFQVKPAPDTTYTVAMTYYYALSAMTLDGDTNLVLQKYPQLYLYASLVAASGYVDDKKVDAWNSIYLDFLDKINTAHRIGQFSGSKLMAKPRNRPE